LTKRVKTFEEALTGIKDHNISVVIFLAYENVFNEQLDSYEGTLPPTIYWSLPGVDGKPRREGVYCADCTIKPHELVALVRSIKLKSQVNKIFGW
jgi:hypothetical protein